MAKYIKLYVPLILVVAALLFLGILFSKNGGMYFSPLETYTIEGSNITYQANRKDIESGRIKIVGSNDLSKYVAIININDCNVTNYTINKKQATDREGTTSSNASKTINGTVFYVNSGMSTAKACSDEPPNYASELKAEVDAIIASLEIK